MRIALAIIMLVLVCSGMPVSAYDLAAHQAISHTAVGEVGDSMDMRLKELGLTDGILTQLSSESVRKTVREWVEHGGASEDDPSPRVVNHFHNPMAESWGTAGLTVGPFRWFSSVVWQQHPAQDTAPGINNGPGTWSWPSARQRYFEALTSAAKSERDEAFARLFRSLGQMMHLVQDASVPAHVRNDQHLTLKIAGFTIVADPDGYEHWVDDVAANPTAIAELLLSRPPIKPSADVFFAGAGAPRIDRTAAPAAVSALIDTGQYTGKNPAVTTTAGGIAPLVGLAEYANANFLSKDTNSLDDSQGVKGLPYPSRWSVQPTLETVDPRTGELRVYFAKTKDGEPIQRLAVATVLYSYLPPFLQYVKVGLDDAVHAEYAEKLLPRAVGYSAAVLDYFFRGAIEARLEGNRLRVTNRTPGESMSGELRLFYDTADGERVPAGQWSVTLGPDQESAPLLLPPLRPDTRPGKADTYLLVFRGRLGLEAGGQFVGEADAVVGLRLKAATLQGHWLVLGITISRDAGPVQSGVYVEPIYEGPLRIFVNDYKFLSTGLDGSTYAGRFLYALYRDLEAQPPNGFTAELAAWCTEDFPVLGLGGYRSAAMEIVEFYPPASREELDALRFDTNPPVVKRVLASLGGIAGYFESVTMPMDLTGARFLGARVLDQPTHFPSPPQPGHGLANDNVCGAFAILNAVE